MQWLPEKVKATLRPAKRFILSPLTPKLAERADNPYATHLPVLLGVARLFSVRRVLEFGCGEYSTLTFLNQAAFPELTLLTSFENDLDWKNKVEAKVRADARVKLRFIEGAVSDIVRETDLSGYDLIFIDDSTTATERAATINAVTAKLSGSQVALIHDFEVKDYQQASRQATLRLRFDSMNPNTGLVCNQLPMEKKRLKQLQTLLKRYCQVIPPDDLGQWIKLFDSEL